MRPPTRPRRRTGSACQQNSATATAQPERPEELAAQLQTAGLVLLGVVQQQADPPIMLVYLHGGAGQWVDGIAVSMAARVPGVIAVSESPRVPTILVVRLAPTAEPVSTP